MAMIAEEFKKALAKHDTHPSLEHSMYTVGEEYRELREEMSYQDDERDINDIFLEASQLGAVSARMISDQLYRQRN